MSDETPGGRYLCKTGQEVLASTLPSIDPSVLDIMGELVMTKEVLLSPQAQEFLATVPDSLSEIAVTEEMVDAAKDTPGTAMIVGPDETWRLVVTGIYRAMRELEPKSYEEVSIPNPMLALVAERDAERARAEAAEEQSNQFALQWLNAKAQIVRLMAERDQAQNERNEMRDEVAAFEKQLTRVEDQLLASRAKKPAPAHNPFRAFGGDRRRVGS